MSRFQTGPIRENVTGHRARQPCLAVHHVLQRHAVPASRPRGRVAAGAARASGRLPAGADLLRPDALQHRLRARRRSRSCAGSSTRSPTPRWSSPRRPHAWGWSARCTRSWRADRGDARPGARGAGDRAPGARAVRVARRPARRRGRGRAFPHRVAYHPTCHSLRMLAVGERRCGCCARSAGSTWSRCPTPRSAAGSAARSRSRTPTRRWRCSATSCACVLDTGAEVLRGGRQLVPDADRRRPCSASAPGCGRCTSPRSSRATGATHETIGARWATDTPSDRPSRAAARDGAGGYAAASQHRARDPARSAPSAPRWSPSWPTGSSCARRAAAIKERVLRHLDELSARARGRGDARRRRRALGPRRRGVQPRSSPSIAAAHGANEVVKIKSLTTEEIGLNDGARAARDPGGRDRPGAADHPARRRAAVAHPGAGDPQEPDADPRPVRARLPDAPAISPTTPSSLSRRAGAPAPAVPARRRSASAAPTSPSPRPAPSASSSPRATAACARPCPRSWSR